MIQDIAPERYEVTYKALQPDKESRLIYFADGKLLVRVDGDSLDFPLYGKDAQPSRPLYLFTVGKTPFFLVQGEQLPALCGYSFENASVFRRHLEPKAFNFAGITAFHLAKWYRDNRYCGACGQEMQHSDAERMLRCPKCGNRVYPKISPVVIVGVKHGDKLLMTKYKGREAGDYALVAGFIEIGESPEDAVRREVYEETGVQVKNLHYYRSQPWGYSDSLLLGFFAELNGDSSIRIQEDELGMAEWVERERIPNRFDDFSLTNDMICAFKEGREK